MGVNGHGEVVVNLISKYSKPPGLEDRTAEIYIDFMRQATAPRQVRG